MKFQISELFFSNQKAIFSMVENFNKTGENFIIGKRNSIKIFDFQDKKVNIKSFKVPHLINKIAYKYFRKSKAKRSFEYATILLEKGIGTPKPIAYFENYDTIGLKDSYYVSEHLQCDLTFRELVEIPDYPENDTILREFTKFSFDLHQKGIEFMDHSPGNTLIKKRNEGIYDFFLVDLNRMDFHETMDFDSRMENLSHLTPKKEMIKVMSNEYAKLYTNQTESEIFEKMWFFTNDFQERFAKKKRLKKKLKFWKS